jgi:hypothetical protein
MDKRSKEKLYKIFLDEEEGDLEAWESGFIWGEVARVERWEFVRFI